MKAEFSRSAQRALIVGVALLMFGVAVSADDGATKDGATKDGLAEKPEFTELGHTKDDLKTVRKRVRNEKAVLLDVREQSEWDEGHLKDAKFLPLSVIRKGKLTKEQKKLLPKDRPVYCHCGSGGRVLIVSKILREEGYDIRPLKAGYQDLLSAGFEKAKPASGKPKVKQDDSDSGSP